MAINYIRWRGRRSFYWVALGATLGIGNFAHLPFLVQQYGGGLFLALYIISKFLIVVPLLMAEMLIARRGRQSPVYSVESLSGESNLRMSFNGLGYLYLAAGFMLFAFYTVIVGWSINFQWLFYKTPEKINSHAFVSLLASPKEMANWQGVFLLALFSVLFVGTSKGVELFAKVSVPLFLLLLVLLLTWVVVYTPWFESLQQTLIWQPDQLSKQGVTLLIQQALLSSGIGVGAVFGYSLYMPQNYSIGRAAIWITVIELVVAFILMSIIWSLIDPAVFSSGTEVLFNDIPAAILALPYGRIVGQLFYLSLTLCGITSVLFVLTPAVMWLMERLNGQYRLAVFIVLLFGGLASLAAMMSFNVLYPWTWFGMGVFEAFGWLCSQVLVPLTLLLLCIYVGWVLRPELVLSEMNPRSGLFYYSWRMLLKFGTSMAVGVLLLRMVENRFEVSVSLQVYVILALIIGWWYWRWINKSSIFPSYD